MRFSPHAFTLLAFLSASAFGSSLAARCEALVHSLGGPERVTDYQDHAHRSFLGLERIGLKSRNMGTVQQHVERVASDFNRWHRRTGLLAKILTTEGRPVLQFEYRVPLAKRPLATRFGQHLRTLLKNHPDTEVYYDPLLSHAESFIGRFQPVTVKPLRLSIHVSIEDIYSFDEECRVFLHEIAHLRSFVETFRPGNFARRALHSEMAWMDIDPKLRGGFATEDLRETGYLSYDELQAYAASVTSSHRHLRDLLAPGESRGEDHDVRVARAMLYLGDDVEEAEAVTHDFIFALTLVEGSLASRDGFVKFSRDEDQGYAVVEIQMQSKGLGRKRSESQMFIPVNLDHPDGIAFRDLPFSAEPSARISSAKLTGAVRDVLLAEVRRALSSAQTRAKHLEQFQAVFDEAEGDVSYAELRRQLRGEATN